MRDHQENWSMVGYHSLYGINWFKVDNAGKPTAPHPIRKAVAGFLKTCP